MPKSKPRRKKASGTKQKPTRQLAQRTFAPPPSERSDPFPPLSDPDPNYPVCIRNPLTGHLEYFSFPDYDCAGQCTGATVKKERCRNPAWDQGQTSPYNEEIIEGLSPIPEK